MEYLQLTFTIPEGDDRDILIALLSEESFEGFEETPDSVKASIPAESINHERIQALAAERQVTYQMETVEQQNWNAIWEADFHPVVVEGFCTVRASFHPPATGTPYEIIITPKMSFGTGHHATTQLMMENMQEMDFTGKDVFDFGTGTGILAILAKKLGAAEVIAIDNDEWAVPNAIENAEMNATSIHISQGSVEDIPARQYDIILANINRNILLQYMATLSRQVKTGGQLLLSGILTEDREAIVAAATENGFGFIKEKILKNWMTILFDRG